MLLAAIVAVVWFDSASLSVGALEGPAIILAAAALCMALTKAAAARGAAVPRPLLLPCAAALAFLAWAGVVHGFLAGAPVRAARIAETAMAPASWRRCA